MGKRTIREVWDMLVDEAGEEEIERAASVTVEQASKELAAAGFDVAAERKEAAAFLKDLRSGAAPVAPVPAPQPPKPLRSERPPKPRRALTAWLSAAGGAAAAGAVFYAIQMGTATVGAGDPSTARELRRAAMAACDQQRWAECLAGLDEARALDPKGDAEPAVAAARERAVRSILKRE